MSTFRMPHRADSFWQAISDGDKSFFEQITEENNRAVEDHIATATRNNGAYFVAMWDTSDSADPVLTDTTNCTEFGDIIPAGAGAVTADTVGVYVVFANHVVSAGDSTVTLTTNLTGFPPVASSMTEGTVSGVFLTGAASGEAAVVAFPTSSDLGSWTGELTMWGFKVGEAADLF